MKVIRIARKQAKDRRYSIIVDNNNIDIEDV